MRYANEVEVVEVDTPPAPEPAQPVHKAAGLLEVTSDPTLAEVVVNNNFNGLTPRRKRLSAGEYEVQVTKQGFLPFTKTITVPPGETVEMYAELKAIKRESVESEPVTDETRRARRVKPASNSRIAVIGVR